MNEDSMELKTLLRINDFVKGSMFLFYIMLIIDIIYFFGDSNILEITFVITSFFLGCYIGSLIVQNMILKLGEDYIED